MICVMLLHSLFSISSLFKAVSSLFKARSLIKIDSCMRIQIGREIGILNKWTYVLMAVSIICEWIIFQSEESEIDDDLSPWVVPQDSSFQFSLWLLTWPALVLLTLTIPSCKKEKQTNYVFTFISSVIWIGVISYLCSWMVTIISKQIIPLIVNSQS